MAKRFTDTNKYKKPFIRSLQGAYKLLWDYLYHECDHAGIWIVDFEIAQIHLGPDSKINKSDALKFFNEGEIRVYEIDKNRWFLPGFIDFQYGELNPENRAHNSVIKVLKSFNLIDSDFNIKPLTSPLQGAKDKDMDKDMDKDKDKEGENFQKNLTQQPIDFKKEFDKFRRAYPGTKGGFEKEYKNFQKHKDWRSEILKLWLALEKEIDWRANRPPDKFTPEWKHLQTWINGRCWEQEFESTAQTIKSKSRIQDENIAKGLENFLHKQKLQDANLPKLEAGTVPV